MGCDGGTIPRRGELVKTKRKSETKDHTSHLIFQWRYCNLSQQLLHRPIVTCGLGKLYNKSSIIEALINKTSPTHIKSLKDILDLNFGATNLDVSFYLCPVTALEMNGRYPFMALWSCGCMISARALKNLGVKVCPKCQKPYTDTDVQVLNPQPSETSLLVHQIKMRKRMVKKRKLSQH